MPTGNFLTLMISVLLLACCVDSVRPSAPVAARPAALQQPAPAHPSASMRDYERLPERLPPPEPHGAFVRLQLGVGVALLTTGETSQLRLPSFAHLDRQDLLTMMCLDLFRVHLDATLLIEFPKSDIALQIIARHTASDRSGP